MNSRTDSNVTRSPPRSSPRSPRRRRRRRRRTPSLSDDGTPTVVRRRSPSQLEPAPQARHDRRASIYARVQGRRRDHRHGERATPFGTEQQQQAQGSGFVYDAHGHVVTNQHVVDGAELDHGALLERQDLRRTLVGTDPSTDLAVIKVDAPASMLQPLALGDSSALEVGDEVVAIGSPFGLEGTVTTGIVSALHRQMTAPNNFTINDSIQTDAAINHGNSGGPLLDTQGRVDRRQRADRERLRRERRRRLRDPVEHRPLDRRRSSRRRQRRARVPRRPDHGRGERRRGDRGAERNAGRGRGTPARRRARRRSTAPRSRPAAT